MLVLQNVKSRRSRVGLLIVFVCLLSGENDGEEDKVKMKIVGQVWFRSACKSSERERLTLAKSEEAIQILWLDS